MKRLLIISSIFLSLFVLSTTSVSAAPIANAGPDQTIYLTQTSTATLNGSASSSGTYQWSEVSTDYKSGATITSPNSAITTVTGLPIGTFYFKLTVTDSSGLTASDSMMINVDYTSPPANAILMAQPNWQNMAPNANLRNTDYHTCYAWQGTQYDVADGYEMEKGGVLGSSIDNMFGKYYSTLNDGYDCVASSTYQPYGRSELIPLSHSIDLLTAGITYVFDWKGYTKEDFSKILSPGKEFVMVWQLHGNDGNSPPLSFSVGRKSSTDNTIYFGVMESYGNGTNGVGDPIGNTYKGDYWIPIVPVSDFYNHAHDIRITIKEGLQNTGAFWNVQYDGKIVYSRTTGQVGQTLGSDWYKFSSMYDWSNSLINALDSTPNGDSASLVTEKFSHYKLSNTVTPNQSPTANAGANQTITLPTNSIILSGSGTDSDGSIASYSWVQTSGPSSASISNRTSPSSTVTGLIQGTYQFQLTVTDNLGATGTSSVNVTVNPVATSSTPVTVYAGDNQTITLPTNSVTLSATTTGSISSYRWTQTQGNTATITSPTSATTTVTNLSAGTYKFVLVVTGTNGTTATDYVYVTVNGTNTTTTTPIANAGPDQTIYLTQTSTATLNGSASSSGTYQWSEVSTDYKSGATITSPNSAITTVTGLPQGV
ncbi:MAG: hypothetical protein KGI58_01665, partial [Patescibacteria group bacterium]|nr:hypothetical protein [Patescibacteria group bacterium]